MFSADGEYVEFDHAVLLEGPVEVNSLEKKIVCIPAAINSFLEDFSR